MDVASHSRLYGRSEPGRVGTAHHLSYQNPDLQNQMGHACAANTEHYRKWVKRQLAEYDANVPALNEVREIEGKPTLRLFRA